jgi:hypothetical protein
MFGHTFRPHFPKIMLDTPDFKKEPKKNLNEDNLGR